MKGKVKRFTLLVIGLSDNGHLREWHEPIHGRSVKETLQEAREDIQRVYPGSKEMKWELR